MSYEPLRLIDVRDRVARVANICATSDRIAELVNEAQERLMQWGQWVGTVSRVRICTNSACITWPRQIQTILAYSFQMMPGTIRDQWYEFLPCGPGELTECCGNPLDLLPRDPACTFDDLWDNQSYVALQCDVPEAAGSYAIIQGYDSNQQWIRRNLGGGVYEDGVRLNLSTTLQVSPMQFSNVTRVILPADRNGMARLWQYRDSAIQKPLGFYESDEVVPWYNRSFIPNLSNAGTSSACGCDTHNQTPTECCCKKVVVLAKLRHIKVHNDNDWLILRNGAAIKLAVQAILMEERADVPIRGRSGMSTTVSAEKWQAAIGELEREKLDYEGPGQQIVLKIAHPDLFGCGAVENDIGLING